jgi:hypothetical protein
MKGGWGIGYIEPAMRTRVRICAQYGCRCRWAGPCSRSPRCRTGSVSCGTGRSPSGSPMSRCPTGCALPDSCKQALIRFGACRSSAAHERRHGGGCARVTARWGLHGPQGPHRRRLPGLQRCLDPAGADPPAEEPHLRLARQARHPDHQRRRQRDRDRRERRQGPGLRPAHRSRRPPLACAAGTASASSCSPPTTNSPSSSSPPGSSHKRATRSSLRPCGWVAVLVRAGPGRR